MDIIQRNFFRLLRTGAFDDKEVVEPMSAFKWRRLYQMVEVQNVTDIFVSGVNKQSKEESLNLPDDLKADVQQRLDAAAPSKKLTTGLEQVELSNHFLNKKLQKLMNAERHSIDTSLETMQLLSIIITNMNSMLNNGLSLSGIIRLGQYLRRRGDRVDFVKLESWLHQLHLSRMAQLEGSILMVVFGFEQDELPFVVKEEKDAYDLTIRAISNLAKDTAKEWHFRQSSTGFVRNNSAILRRNIRRSIRYINYAPVETTSSFFTNLARSLSEIEE